MSDFSDALEAVFDASIEMGMGSKITFNGLSVDCVMTGFNATRKAKRGGREEDFGPTIAELRESERVRLGIADHSTVTVQGIKLKVIEIDSDPADPLTRLRLQYQP